MFKKLLVASAAVVLVGVGVRPAAAIPITYNSVGAFGNGTCVSCVSSGTTNSTVSLGGLTITYTQAASITTDPLGGISFINYGTFTSSGSGSADFTGATITITTTVTAPAPTGGSPFNSVGTLTGTLTTNGSGTFITFQSPFEHDVTFAGGTAIFKLIEADGGTQGVSAVPQPGGTANSIDATLQTVPEPGSMMLLGSGLVGLSGMIRRRLKK